MAEEKTNSDSRDKKPKGSGGRNNGGGNSKPASGQDDSRRIYLRGAMVMLGLALVSFVTASVFGSYSGGPPTVLKIPAEELRGGKIVGKIEPTRDYASFQVELRHPINYTHQWSQVTGEVLDANQNMLFAFGEELWAGIEENKLSFSANFNFPKKDTYYLKLSVEMAPNASNPPPLEVTYGQTAGSGVMFNWLGALAVIVGVGLWLVKGGGGGAILTGFGWLTAALMVSWPFLLVGGIVFLCIFFDVDCSD